MTPQTPQSLANRVRHIFSNYHGHQWRNIKSIALMPKGFHKMPPGITAGLIFLPDVDGVIVYSNCQLQREKLYKDAKLYWVKEGRADPPKSPRTKEAKQFYKDWGLTNSGKAVV